LSGGGSGLGSRRLRGSSNSRRGIDCRRGNIGRSRWHGGRRTSTGHGGDDGFSGRPRERGTLEGDSGRPGLDWVLHVRDNIFSCDNPSVGEFADLAEEIVEPSNSRGVSHQPLGTDPNTKRGPIAVVVQHEIVVIMVLKFSATQWRVDGANWTSVARIIAVSLIESVHGKRPKARIGVRIEVADTSPALASIAKVHGMRPHLGAQGGGQGVANSIRVRRVVGKAEALKTLHGPWRMLKERGPKANNFRATGEASAIGHIGASFMNLANGGVNADGLDGDLLLHADVGLKGGAVSAREQDEPGRPDRAAIGVRVASLEDRSDNIPVRRINGIIEG